MWHDTAVAGVPPPSSIVPSDIKKAPREGLTQTGTTPRITIGPSHSHSLEPVAARRPMARDGSKGIVSAIAHRYRL